MARSRFGHCIYCGRTKNLTSEHVIPFGLGGDFELPGASCRACQEITSAIEAAVLRDHLIGPRLAIGYPSRHARARGAVPSYPIVFVNDVDGGKKPVTLPDDLHPTFLWLPQYEQPGDITGQKIIGIKVDGVEIRQVSGMDMRQYAKATGTVSIGQTQTVKGYEFARMLGKIALGFAADHFGVDYRDSPLGDVIRAKRDDAGRWIGQPTLCPPPLARTYLINGGLHVVKLYAGSEIWAIIQLFAAKNTTMDYLAIVVPRPEARRVTLCSWLGFRYRSLRRGTPRVHLVTIEGRTN